jgi:hypothetical protein
LKLFLYFLPLIVPVCFVISILFISKELIPANHIIDNLLSSNKAYLFGLAYSYQDPYYKKQLVIRSKPNVLVLGTSRVMQFKKCFFKDNAKFANAGGGVATIQQFIPFFENISSIDKPDIIIIGLDQYFFNVNWNNNNKFDSLGYSKSLNNPPTVISIILDSYTKIFKDVRENKIQFSKLFEFERSQRIGISAIMKSDGFLNDGSYRYGSKITSQEKWTDYQFKDTFYRIENGNNRFEYGNDVSEAVLKELDKILSYCKQKQIYVIGFLPPFAPSVINKMKAKGSKYDYIWQINSRLTPMFERYSYGFFDFTDMTNFGSKDSEFIDGFHGSDITYAKLFVAMSKVDPVLSKFSNLKQIELSLSHPYNDTMLSDDGF